MPAVTSDPAVPAPLSVLIVSASMGAGHDGAARELCQRLESRGHRVRVVDYLAAVPLRLGPVVRSSYKWQLRLIPSSYEASYQTWVNKPARAGPLAAALSKVTGPALRRWVTQAQPDVIVSTYPLCSLVLGRDRLRGDLAAPVATFVTDFAVHPLWTHPGVDLHLTVHPQAAADAERLSGRAGAAPGPLVPGRFMAVEAGEGAVEAGEGAVEAGEGAVEAGEGAVEAGEGAVEAGEGADGAGKGTDEAGVARDRRRARARELFGIGDDERVVLLVAGSWGVGQITETFADVVATGRYTPLAVCGRNEGLCRKLAGQPGGRAIGWTDAMPDLLVAADVLVQNAGGLTCMEAFATGLPVVSYRPIAGHGRANASEMERAGVALYARDPADLGPALDQATGERHASLVAAGRAMFAGDAAADVVRLGGG